MLPPPRRRSVSAGPLGRLVPQDVIPTKEAARTTSQGRVRAVDAGDEVAGRVDEWKGGCLDGWSRRGEALRQAECLPVRAPSAGPPVTQSSMHPRVPKPVAASIASIVGHLAAWGQDRDLAPILIIPEVGRLGMGVGVEVCGWVGVGWEAAQGRRREKNFLAEVTISQ